MKKILVILGPTSTGKTDLALSLAKKNNGVIISADSRQVYKYLDIGTGKFPGKFTDLKKNNGFWEIDGIKVWLYDQVDPKERFNLYEFISEAEAIVNRIHEVGKLPILAGGTGLYIRSLLEGLSSFGVAEDKQLREKLEKLDISEIRQWIDKNTLNQLNNSELNNKRRLIRLVEIQKSSDKVNSKKFLGLGEFNTLKIGLCMPKKILDERIKKKVLSRVKQGMIEESKDLLGRSILDYERMEQLGLEYRYIAKFLRGEIKNLDEFIDILSLKITQFAKRQMTWFKKEKNVLWFDVSNQSHQQKLEKTVSDWYNDAQ